MNENPLTLFCYNWSLLKRKNGKKFMENHIISMMDMEVFSGNVWLLSLRINEIGRNILWLL
jgi:hypothetical protein